VLIVVALLGVVVAAFGTLSQRDDSSDLATSTEATTVGSLALSDEVVAKARSVVSSSVGEASVRGTVYRAPRGEANKAANAASVDSPQRQVFLVVLESPSPLILRYHTGPPRSKPPTGTVFSFTLAVDNLRVLDLRLGYRGAVGIDPSWPSTPIELVTTAATNEISDEHG
jgi:hypothetical protein